MDIKEIRTYLEDSLSRVEAIMDNCLKSDISLLEATNRSLRARNGKMLRPILCLLVSGACSGRGATTDGEKFAAATELLHNATLLHDDVVDSSGERRGKPTVMSILGSPASVLIGDFWLVKAMDSILSSEKSGNIVIRIFAKTLSDLAEGEMLQL
ncbi:MAG: polyprenyl synthetase family protein, partial [Bacteroidales bacterium]|nr:polyprenyl synthetase family protein [Bacteroidales bacterium]